MLFPLPSTKGKEGEGEKRIVLNFYYERGIFSLGKKGGKEERKEEEEKKEEEPLSKLGVLRCSLPQIKGGGEERKGEGGERDKTCKRTFCHCQRWEKEGRERNLKRLNKRKGEGDRKEKHSDLLPIFFKLLVAY